MRITYQSLNRNYLKRMDGNLTRLTRSNEKMASGRAYTQGDQNVSDAGKALKIRQMLDDNLRFNDTIRDVQGRVAAAEDGIRTVNSLLANAKDRMIQGMNGTFSQSDRDKIAVELERAQEEVLQIMNIQYADKHLYAASGNPDGSPPFTKGVAGELLYNGSPVDDLVKDPATGRPSTVVDMGGGVLVYTEIPYNKPNYVDIGLNFELMADGSVDPNTGFKDTYSGIECFGYGKNAEGVPVNAFSLFGHMAQNLRAGNMEAMGDSLDAIGDSMNFLLTSVTELGARSVTLDNTSARLDREFENLADTQNKLESVDISREAMLNKNFETSWMVTLQLSSKILPQTIFDFIR